MTKITNQGAMEEELQVAQQDKGPQAMEEELMEHQDKRTMDMEEELQVAQQDKGPWAMEEELMEHQDKRTMDI